MFTHIASSDVVCTPLGSLMNGQHVLTINLSTATQKTPHPTHRVHVENDTKYMYILVGLAGDRGPVAGVGGRVGKLGKSGVSHGKGEGHVVHAGINCICNVCGSPHSCGCVVNGSFARAAYISREYTYNLSITHQVQNIHVSKSERNVHALTHTPGI